MKSKTCPLCHEKLFSEIGKACKMCGMALDDEGKDFCSRTCKRNYLNIRKSAAPVISRAVF